MRGAAKGNVFDPPAGRTPSRETASKGLEGIRETAKRDRRVKFTALLHHITPSLLVESFYDLNKTAVVGVDFIRRNDSRYNPRQEPCAVVPLAGICAGGLGNQHSYRDLLDELECVVCATQGKAALTHNPSPKRGGVDRSFPIRGKDG